MSALEDSLAWQIKIAGLPHPERQIKPIPGRKFSFDFAWPEHHLLLEVQGGIWDSGKHGRGSGILKDQEKLFLALLEGWMVLQISGVHIKDGRAIQWLRQLFEKRGLTPG